MCFAKMCWELKSEIRVCGWTVDPVGAQEEVLQLVSELGLSVIVAVAYELPESFTGASLLRLFFLQWGFWTWIGCLELMQLRLLLMADVHHKHGRSFTIM